MMVVVGEEVVGINIAIITPRHEPRPSRLLSSRIVARLPRLNYLSYFLEGYQEEYLQMLGCKAN